MTRTAVAGGYARDAAQLAVVQSHARDHGLGPDSCPACATVPAVTNDSGISLAAKTELLATALHENRGGEWTITEPGFVRGPGSTAVAIQPDDSGTPSHLDLEFILNVDRREETSVVDCVTGIAKDPSDAVRHAIFQWLQTTGAAVFELFEHAGHFSHDDPLVGRTCLLLLHGDTATS